MKKLSSLKSSFVGGMMLCLLTATSCTTEDEPTAAVLKTEKSNIENTIDADKAYAYVEQMPQFKGGEQALMQFLGEHIEYPQESRKAGVEGITVITFVIEKDGTVTDVTTVKRLSPETDEEARRVVELTSGNWSPGQQNGETVRVKYTIPVRFAIR
ncbi:energy transducer TonB [Pontibacter sp. CAU 1760]